ncbi:helix-turn-helix domain-containing protein [Vallitalea guaymasensis]|uniref:helix-turn-helix domain-containing protein n=1 Tax=Vallitalea guaymasensis TaxID=1185412 RepID=UPI000DE29165|nr:helix-turn-helix transcriptional regulator [Vallitalea guaymasensis]
MTLGQRIKKRRLELDLTVEEVANKLNKNKATIYRYENDEIENLSITVLQPLATVLNTTPDYLMGWDGIQRTADAMDSLKVMLKEIYDSVIIKDYDETGTYDIILIKGKIKICLEEMGFQNLFNTICSIIPSCIDVIVDNTSKEKYDEVPPFTCLSDEEVPALDMYRQLDITDKAEIRGEMKHMLKSEKYSVKKELRNA